MKCHNSKKLFVYYIVPFNGETRVCRKCLAFTVLRFPNCVKDHVQSSRLLENLRVRKKNSCFFAVWQRIESVTWEAPRLIVKGSIDWAMAGKRACKFRECYNFADMQASVASSCSPALSFGAACAVDRGRLLVYHGGTSKKDSSPTNLLHVFDVASSKWFSLCLRTLLIADDKAEG